MFDWADIFSYLVMHGFAFAALCVITRVGRGWILQTLGLLALAGLDILLEWWFDSSGVPLPVWLSVFFLLWAGMFIALGVALSRDSFGRRLFLSLTYCAYAACYLSVFHSLAYRNVFGLSDGWAVVIGLSFVAVANLAFLFWVLPLIPHGSRDFPWRDPCLAAGVMLVVLFASGFWPVSVVSAPARQCVPFALMSVFALLAFPMLCRSMRDYLRAREVEHSITMLTDEMNIRRMALDEARRIRHDHRHHRTVLGGLLLRGKSGEALEYLNALDEDEGDLSLSTRVWCENETVNAILAGCLRRATVSGVDFSAEAHVERTASLSDMDIVAVVANLGENAINACGRYIVDPAERKVRVILRQRGDMFGLTVANAVPAGFRLSAVGLPCAEPGVGLLSVRRVVNRYSGEWQYTLDGAVLTCELVLYAGGTDANRNL